MHAVDTNILVRFLLRDDEEQALLAKIILETEDVWISKTVLLETEWVLRSVYKFSPLAVEGAINHLVGLPGIEVEGTEAVVAALALFSQGLDFADALHLTSRPPNSHFVTFDESLIKAAKRLGARSVLRPSQSTRRSQH